MAPPREGSLEAPTRHAIDWQSPEYFDAAALNAALKQNAGKLEEMLVGTHRGIQDLMEAVKGQKQEIVAMARMVQDLLAEHRLADRELRPQDGMSIRSPVERRQVTQ